MYAGKQGDAVNHLQNDRAKDKVSKMHETSYFLVLDHIRVKSVSSVSQRAPQKFSPLLQDVVILGSGAFGLEAMEAASRSRARYITLVTRDRDR